MTKTQFRKRTKQLKLSVARLIDDRIEKVIKSGCLDLDAYEDNYLLPNIFMSAIGKEIEFQFRPPSKKMQKESRNISHFL